MLAAQATHKTKNKNKNSKELLTSKKIRTPRPIVKSITETFDIERPFWVMRPNKLISAPRHYLHGNKFSKKIARTFFFLIVRASQKG